MHRDLFNKTRHTPMYKRVSQSGKGDFIYRQFGAVTKGKYDCFFLALGNYTLCIAPCLIKLKPSPFLQGNEYTHFVLHCFASPLHRDFNLPSLIIKPWCPIHGRIDCWKMLIQALVWNQWCSNGKDCAYSTFSKPDWLILDHRKQIHLSKQMLLMITSWVYFRGNWFY